METKPPSADPAPQTRKTISLDYTFTPKSRYGYGKPPHPELYRILDGRRDAYAEFLKGLKKYVPDFSRIPVKPESAPRNGPCWQNGWFPGLASATLYGFLCQLNPKRFLEVGSGNSTKFARQAIRDHGLRTSITSVDPAPRAEIDSICDRCIRSRFEDLDPGVLADLEAEDILFVDGSHRTFMTTDATVFFLEVLPRLKPGVVVQIHDIFLPYDYPPQWTEWYYSEQYLLACYLIGGWPRLKILMANAFISLDTALLALAIEAYAQANILDINHGGGSFWMEML